MKKVSISKMKAELSHFIKMVKKGDDFLILDRDRPVAMLTRVQDQLDFVIQEATSDGKDFFKNLKIRRFEESTDILDLLESERGDRF